MTATQRWYPTVDQLKDPARTESAFRQLLDQHYALLDKVNGMAAASKAEKDKPAPKGPPPGCGPTDTQICGLRVAPVDVQSLADGTKLTYVKKNGNFQFM